MAKKTNNKSRKPDNTEKIPLPHDSDKIGKDVSKDRVWTRFFLVLVPMPLGIFKEGTELFAGCQISELVQLKLNLETSMGESTPTEVEYGTPTW